MKTETVSASDGKELFTRLWTPGEDPKAVILLIHGMGEHSARYADFAQFLTARDFAVFAYDHRGHGFTDEHKKGVIPVEDSFQQMVMDIGTVRSFIRGKYPNLPLFLFAHSMGSFLTMRHLQTATDTKVPAGVMYSGTSGAVSPLLPFGILFSALLRRLFGDSYKSELLRNIVFKPYNNSFKPTRTRHDWISRDEEAIDRYVEDPNCGFTPSVSFLNDFFSGLRKTQNHTPFSGHLTYPVQIIAGSEDPISKPLNGISKLEEKLRSSGIDEIEIQVYEGGRHEMLSELNKEQVMGDILNWLESVLQHYDKVHEPSLS